MSDITQNDFLVQDSFTFVNEISTQDNGPYMTSLDVDALFANILLEETIDIYVKKLFQNLETLVKYFHDLLNLASKESFCSLATSSTFR